MTLDLSTLLKASLAVLLVFGAGCDSTADDDTMTEDPVASVAALQADYEAALDHLDATVLTTTDGPVSSDVLVDASLDFYADRYGETSDRYVTLAEGMRGVQSGAVARAPQDISPTLESVTLRVDEARQTSVSFVAFQTELAEIRSDVIAEDWSARDTENALAYIALLDSSMEFLRDHAALAGAPMSNSARMHHWWDSWGKCAAGVVGGGILGGLTGAGAGSVVPAIGTAAGGVAGAIGGGLSGAAAAC